MRDFPRRARRAGALIGLAGAALFASQAGAQTRGQAQQSHSSVHPYLEVQQVMTADFSGSGDVLTYTSVGGGIDASIETRKVHATVSYNYQHYFSWQKGEGDSDSHQGLAAARLEVVPGTLALDAGAVATRSGGGVRLPGPALPGDNRGLVDVYSVYAGPSLSTHAGALAVNASYHLGYVKVDDDDIARVPGGAPRVDRYSSSTIHQADVSIGMEPGDAPVGWTVGAGWSHEDMNRFKSRYDAKYVRADVVVPVSGTFAVTGGIGYEDIKSSQQDLLRDSSGAPVVTPQGEVTADPSRPRLTTYDDDGVIWDVGAIWRPSPRTEAQARYGRRYGSDTFTASLRQQLSPHYTLNAMVYDNVSSFGRILVSDLNGLPRNFNIRRNPLFQGIGPGGCVFGNSAGTGTCFDSALQRASNFNFRNRGAEAMVSGGRGPWTFGIGGGYSNRKYLTPTVANFSLAGATDESFNIDALASRQLTANSGYDVEVFGNWYDSGIAGVDNSFSTGITFNYYRTLMGERLSGNIAAGLYSTDAGVYDSTTGALQLGLRYTF
jgi:hypothetical protein